MSLQVLAYNLKHTRRVEDDEEHKNGPKVRPRGTLCRHDARLAQARSTKVDHLIGGPAFNRNNEVYIRPETGFGVNGRLNPPR